MRHTSRMPRWNPRRARQLVLDLDPLAALPTGPSAAAAGASTSGGRGARGASVRSAGRGAGESNGRARGAAAASAAGPRAPPPGALEAEGGGLIDDDVGMNYNFSTGRGSGGNGSGGGAWAGRGGGAARAEEEEEFPSLAASAARAAPAGAPQLVKVTSSCPCGRRSMSLAARPGEVAPPLACDRSCAENARRQQLADAFEVADPNRAPYWERTRQPEYSALLLQVGWCALGGGRGRRMWLVGPPACACACRPIPWVSD